MSDLILDDLAIAMGDAILALRAIEARIFTLLQPMVCVGLALVHPDDWVRLRMLCHERKEAEEIEHEARRAYMSALMRRKDEE